ncbi:uncharacterized protein B0T15DRAFT_571165 [Chaetomium strumarium]|uniref:SET domain-containing protein n=1 Tax=Chaetomium strumarium TaxID=1170767 RepID=A0AAJ0H321_9PEZI|nr:hypothetical protein B0T15DRAFT_571165 [Chaetomium strumarium]
METSSEDVTVEEIMVATSTITGRTSMSAPKQLSRKTAGAGKTSRAQSPSNRSRTRTPNQSPADRSPRGTPSRETRFSTRDEIRDSQSPPPTVNVEPAANHEPNPPPQPSMTPSRPARGHHTPRKMDWTVEKIAIALNELSEEVGHGHARLVDFVLEEAEKTTAQTRHLSTVDVFAKMKSTATEGNGSPPGVQTMAVKFKQHSGEYGKSKGSARRVQCPVVGIKPDREAVPRYRFHHVEIRKNILAPNSMLNFVPHLRDVDPNSIEEQKYAAWLMDLENLDSKSGFRVENRAQKMAKRLQNEYAAALAPYLERWLRKLAIDGCTKSTLIRYMATQAQNEDAITPQQKSNLLDTHSEDIGSPHAVRGAKLFTEAFDRVFNNPKSSRRVALRDILMLDRSVEPILDNKRAKDGPGSQKPRDEALMQKIVESLGSYSTLGCLICFSHDCEHGEIERDNQKRCFSLEEIGGLAPTLRAKWAAQLKAQNGVQSGASTDWPTHPSCSNQCYRSYNTGKPDQEVKAWSENEVSVLEWTFATIGYSPSLKPQCFVAAVLGRPCWDVHRKFKELDLTLPPVEPRAEQTRPKAVSWYDRKRKQLLGDWQDATITHEHAVRELYAPCHHEGPCTAANGCPCASGGSHPVLCERFCLCTAEECPLKFTGCACHSLGKTCLQRQKEGRPCICVQLNRECDPVLCKGCGAKERADPENAYDEQLHSTGCQNVALQRGAAKALLLGKSQLEACGYGLFAAEDIAQDEFVIEYTGELISHDEGVRRENRRGDVFDEENKISYLFTLLEQEGIWVDAAIYGNLSRYINHASDNCNIMPRIMYVNHEFRIKFSALRDIKAGEELFFNYGDNFPNLTKKLVERTNEKAGAGSGGKSSAGQKRKGGAQRPTARKTTSKANGEGIDFAPDDRRGGDDDDIWGDIPVVDDNDDDIDDWADRNPKRRKKRGGRRPGAGRKKKQPQPATAEVATADEGSPGSQLRAESSGVREESPHPETPSRRRVAKMSYVAMLNPRRGGGSSLSEKPEASAAAAVAAGSSVASTTTEPVKKVSKRGGARPGAGRKPKHHRHNNNHGAQSQSQSSQQQSRKPGASSNNSNNNNSSSSNNKTSAHHASQSNNTSFSSSSQNDTDQQHHRVASRSSPAKKGEDNTTTAAAATTDTSNNRAVRSTPKRGEAAASAASAAAAAGRKRKASEVEAEDAAISSSNGGGGSGGLYRQDTFQPITDNDTASVRSGRSRGRSGGEDDEDDVVDRSARKRQKPLRYRDEEE